MAPPQTLTPMAGGQPLSEAVADQAADWLTLLMSGEATSDDQARWRAWRSGHPDHERAWRHIEAVTGRLQAMEPRAAYQALSPYAGNARAPGSAARRQALRLLLWGGVATGAGLLAMRTDTARQYAADHRSATGERRTVTLADATHITLNTASAIDVRFDAQRRLVRLVAGEILVATGHGQDGQQGQEGQADARPFFVQTGEGLVQALGTRFTVRQWPDGRTSVAVLQSAVEIAPEQGAVQRLQAGQRATFTRGAVQDGGAVQERDAAWTRGQIVADEMRLQDFADELARYRPGWVRCSPEVAGLRLSGVFPLDDTDRILAALPSVVPVQVRLRTRYWVALEAAP